ncbi:hypothetical protein I3842_09G161200 [Carya illinoinensis]|uniref:Reverse transcriptase zinc-binding domain-containing protein n=1 Tax=Carya illinoinensis TaxID=32201 RepID=A0A922J7W0_CARIL|nr:hypothetical protein I3842_09G161200 [Carya illinoinensis]
MRSYVWRSIISGIELLKEGLVWRIGNSSQVKIWEDKWIPKLHTFRIQSNKEEMLHKNWNEPLLVRLFSAQEVDIIKSIPISIGGRDDQLVWHHTKNSLFSVRSAYFLHRAMLVRSTGETSNDKLEDGFWKDIWKLPVPNTVRSFIWRACNEALPTIVNLVKRKLVENSNCPISLVELEPSEHVLWSCGAAKDIWSQEVWEHLCKHLQDNSLREVAMIARLICNRRNDFWPTWSWEVSSETVMGTIQAKRQLKLEAFSGEAYAMMMCISFYKEVGVNQFILEDDALQSYEGHIIEEAKVLLNNFAEWHAVHAKREGNKTAHVLAHNTLSLSEDVYDFEEIPFCVQHVVSSDML